MTEPECRMTEPGVGQENCHRVQSSHLAVQAVSAHRMVRLVAAVQ
jgi:hypothetical protein